MPSTLGGIFLHSAIGPVSFAGTCIMARKVVQGLNELSTDNLLGAVSRGAKIVADEAGVAASDVERLLPMSELRGLAAQIEQGQVSALEAWELHAGHVGGLLDGVADLTIDGRPPDIGLCLQRLAQKVSRDKEWSRPLSELAELTASYQNLLYAGRKLLDQGGTLARAVRLKRMRRLIMVLSIATVAVVIALVSAVLVVRQRAARQRIGAELVKDDPCAVEAIVEDDLAKGTDDQRATVEERRTRCVERREQERAARAEQRRLEAEERERARLKKQRDDQCAALLTAVTAGSFSDELEQLAGNAGPLLGRMALRRLKVRDLAPPDPELPCADTPSGAGFGKAYDDLVVRQVAVWIQAEDVSHRVSGILTAARPSLRMHDKMLFALQAERQATKAIIAGRDKGLERAGRLCELKRALEVVRGHSCDAVFKLLADRKNE